MYINITNVLQIIISFELDTVTSPGHPRSSRVCNPDLMLSLVGIRGVSILSSINVLRASFRRSVNNLYYYTVQSICINTVRYRLLELDSVISLRLLLDLLIKQVDRPLRRECNWSIEPGVIVPPNLADRFIIFRTQRDLLKVFGNAVCPFVNRLFQFFRHSSLTRLHRLGDHRVASRHPPCNQDLRCGCAKPFSHLLHFGIVYQPLLALHYPRFQSFIITLSIPRVHSQLFPSGEYAVR
jgi:hypothetical protein